jgi:ABC-type multidrug transport system fused ATPase/permease subunit
MYHELIRNFWTKHYGKILGFIIVTATILPLESIGFASYTSKIVSKVQGDGKINKGVVYRCIIMIALIYFVTRLLSALQYYFEILIDSYLIRDVRDNMFHAFIEKNKKDYQEIELGKLVSYFNVIPHAYQELIYRFLKYVIPYTIAIAILIVYFFIVNQQIGVIMLAMVLTIVVVFTTMIRKCIRTSIERHDRLHQNNEDIQDKMSNLFSVLVNNQDRSERDRNLQREDGYRKKSFQANLEYVKLETAINIVLVVSMTVILLVYYRLFQRVEKSHRALLISSFLEFFYFIGYINSVKWSFIDVFSKVGIIKSYEQNLFPKKDSNQSTTNKKRKDFIKLGQIIVDRISFSYGDRVIHKNLSMTLKPNTINIIRGHSGQGKTTLIKLILGFYPVKSGSIRIDNVNVQDADSEYIRSQTSMVTQDVKLFNTSIYNNIRYGNESVSMPQVDRTIQSMGLYNTVFKNLPKRLSTQAGANGSNLSNGQRQVTLLLRALIQNRKLIVLDEPTASLDSTTKKMVLDVIKRISRDKTTIIITHDTLDLKGNVIKLSK